jgi:hypothetical protein
MIRDHHAKQRMIDHMELEPESLAPCVLLLENSLFPKKQKLVMPALCRGEGLRRGGVKDGRDRGGGGGG